MRLEFEDDEEFEEWFSSAVGVKHGETIILDNDGIKFTWNAKIKTWERSEEASYIKSAKRRKIVEEPDREFLIDQLMAILMHKRPKSASIVYDDGYGVLSKEYSHSVYWNYEGLDPLSPKNKISIDHTRIEGSVSMGANEESKELE